MLFILLTRLIGKEVHPEQLSIETLKQEVKEKISASCPKVEWIANYALFSQYDYLDIFSAPDIETAMKVSVIVRSYGHAATEIWPALEWNDFKKTISSLPDKKK